ncbi:class I SAM-dependent methyltransferase [Clostridium swellfunianum]|uniref:tRNA (adenine(22)-N(1))-methyltransferase n=1 Tax=Clostridium swellfunianum TaxID=1367462 RepID=UPI00202FA289|nr:class I SAM-dependent methyltransferase [Clostridium swellfunianum]MCM0648810.1 class I SAM-dependent methyltransferase [Clostridium swellfunianum]
MELGIRLKKIASMVDVCDKMADIGTDHAYIPIYLIKNGICIRAVASDINKGPVEKAKKNVKLENLHKKIDCRLGGGFSTIAPKEVQAAVIAGMGGNLIRDIIEEGMEVFKNLESCILQPVQNPEVLRAYIYERGFEILEEELCFEEGKYYEIIKVRYGNKFLTVDSMYYEIGKRLIEDKHPMISEYISYKLDKYCNIYGNLNEDTENAKERKNELKIKIDKLKELRGQCH